MECIICFNMLTEEGDPAVLGDIPSPKRPRETSRALAVPGATANAGPQLNAPSCGHIYHRVCILGWFAKGMKHCPVCRKPFTKTQLKPVFLPSLDDSCKKCNQLEGKVQQLEATLAKEQKDFEVALGKHAEDEAGMERELTDAKKALVESKAKEQISLAAIEALKNEFRIQIEGHQQQNKGLLKDLELERENFNKSSKENQALKKLLHGSQQKNLQLEDENQEHNEMLRGTLGQVKELQKDFTALKTREDELLKKIKEEGKLSNAKLEKISQEKRELKEEVDALKKEKAELKFKMTGDKRIANTKIEELKAENNKFAEKIAEFRIEKQKWEEEREALAGRRNNEALQEEVDRLKEQLQGSLTKEKELRKEIKAHSRRLNEAINENMDLQARVLAEQEKVAEEARKSDELEGRFQLLSNDLDELTARHVREQERGDILEAKIASLKEVLNSNN